MRISDYSNISDISINKISMVIKVFIDYFSQPSRAVLALCKLGQIPHEVVEIRLNRLEVKAS